MKHSPRRLAMRGAPWLIALAGSLLLAGCAKPEFDGDRAYESIVAQCDMGPRPPGCEAHEQTLKWLVSTLKPLAELVSVQRFTAPTDTGDVVLTNVIASFATSERERVLFGTHWDTRWIAERDPVPEQRSAPIPGANDGASGVAVLLELATLMSEHRPALGVDLVFFDGEDGGDGGGLPRWCLGSEYYASHLEGYAPRYAVIVDMIGDADLSVRREPNSLTAAAWLVDRIWDAAASTGATHFSDATWAPVYDDHVPLIRAGIPAALLIDFDYPYWHTQADTEDKCSPESLSEVGRVLVELIY